jgi:hypothetical protein
LYLIFGKDSMTSSFYLSKPYSIPIKQQKKVLIFILSKIVLALINFDYELNIAQPYLSCSAYKINTGRFNDLDIS